MELKDIDEIEKGYCHAHGKPVLGEAFRLLNARWQAGQRDRETCLRLLFLAWYCLSEPTWLTGLPENADSKTLFQSVFAHLKQTTPDNPEFLFVAGYMASLWAWCCGNESQWEEVGRQCLRRFQSTGERLLPETFTGRGAYGHYFSHIIESDWIAQHMESTIRGEPAV
jgi:hypothetical protein